MAAIPKDIEDRLRGHLTAIARLFKAPRITMIVRSPEEGNARGDLILGNDDPYLVACALKARVIDEAFLWAETPDKTRLQVKEKTDGGEGPHVYSGGNASAYQPRRR